MGDQHLLSAEQCVHASKLWRMIVLIVGYRGAGAIAPMQPCLWQNVAQWRRDRNMLTQVFQPVALSRKTFLELKGARHKNIIGLHGCLCRLLNALKIPEKRADLRPRSGIQLPKSFQLQRRGALSRNPLTRGCAPGFRWLGLQTPVRLALRARRVVHTTYGYFPP